MTDLTTNEITILVIGFTGQAMFFMRFFVQWLYSEKHRRSLIPTAFWYFSLAGSFFLLIYAIIKRDPVFIVGQSTGFIIYTRNLILIKREQKEKMTHQPDQQAATLEASQSHNIPVK